MFTQTTEAFGKFSLLTLEDKASDTMLQLVPDHGAMVTRIKFQGVDILDGYETPLEVDLNNWAKSGILFPFPNRLQDGAFEWKGKTYQFPVNDTETENALHGFGMDKPTRIVDSYADDEKASVSCEFTYDGSPSAYPFPFSFLVTFEITAAGALTVDMACTNQGMESIPFGFGWHPYFTLAETVNDMSLQLPEMEMVGIDKRMIPTGKRYSYDHFATLTPIGATVLDNCFAVPEPQEKIELLVTGEKGKLRYWQEAAEEKYAFLQFFTPPDRKSLAIEPMTCNVNAFNNKEGLLEIPAGATRSARFGLQFTTE